MLSYRLHSCMRVSMMKDDMRSIATLSDSASCQSYAGDSLATSDWCVFYVHYYIMHTLSHLTILLFQSHLQIIPLVPKQFETSGLRILFDISFFIIITTIGLNIVLGIIVNTFTELRDERVCCGYGNMIIPFCYTVKNT